VTWTGVDELVDVPLFDMAEVALAVVEAEVDLTLVLETTSFVEVETTDETDEEEAMLVLEATEVVVATTEGEVEEAGTLLLETVEEAEEADARTEEQAACAALRTPRAPVAPQAVMTQLVEPAWMAASLVAEHWQTRSVAPHEGAAVATAAAMQLVAQVGICACAKPKMAMKASAE